MEAVSGVTRPRSAWAEQGENEAVAGEMEAEDRAVEARARAAAARAEARAEARAAARAAASSESAEREEAVGGGESGVGGW